MAGFRFPAISCSIRPQNGQYVPLGGAYGKASLIKITATEVILKGDGGLEVLQLYPPMAKPSAASAAEGKPEKAVERP